MPFADQLKAIEQEKEENRKYQAACNAIHEIRGKEVRAKERAALTQITCWN